ncbi:MAG: transcriptional repressor NrdR [Planctomycetes bacterium]|jgi:transcriptional repressor NrdR|nr:transcriptional repressor NrdR [Planctomycetota bacterium]MCL4729983.1 transcriptional regulator NrdR [Planctomycetota bacterium]
MRCPFCKVDNDRVVDSRASSEGAVVRRRRECLACGKRFTTYERIEETPLRVIKKDGSRAPFDREKIRHGIQRACEKRPVSAAQIEQVVQDIEDDVSKRYDREVPTRVIGELIMEKLKAIDSVAYVRFASVYREFKDTADFLAAIEGAKK